MGHLLCPCGFVSLASTFTDTNGMVECRVIMERTKSSMEETLKSIAMSFDTIATALHNIAEDGLHVEITMNEFDQDRLIDTLDNIVGALSDISEVPLFNIKPTSDDAIPIGMYMGWGSELNVRAQLSNDETSLGTVLPIIVHNDNGDE